MCSLKKILILAIIPISVLAFKPGNWMGGSGEVYNHKTLTAAGIGTMIIDGKTLKFSPDALEEIKNACADVDYYEMSTAAAHCDAENIGGSGGCSERLARFKSSIITTLTVPELASLITGKRDHLGRALHTLQDFYSHSNWVNLGKKTIYTDLTAGTLAEQDTLEGEEDSIVYKTCEWITDSWFDNKPEPVLNLGPRGRTVVTSGWFEGFAGEADPIFYKCDHGLVDGNGLNKDTSSQNLYTDASLLAIAHTKAYLNDIIVAVLASTWLTPEEKAKNIAKFFGDFGDTNLGFIVDTTGSMGDTVTGIKSAMAKTVTKLKEDGKDIANFYLISFGDPGVGNVLTATDSGSMLANINTVQLGVPDGGGDLPEKALDGLLRVVNVAAENTELYLYTDATTKNPGLASTIISTAKAKNITINFFLSGSSDSSYTQIASATGGVIQSYAHSVSGAEGTFALVNPKIDGNLEKLLKIVGVIPGAAARKLSKNAYEELGKGNTTQEDAIHIYEIKESVQNSKFSKMAKEIANGVEHDILIDSSVEKIVLNVEMNPLGTITLFKPDGTEASDADADITITTTNANKFITVDSPESGKWMIRIQGNAGQSYSLDVSITSDTKIVGFNFVELKGRPAHEAFFPLDGQPLNTTEQYVMLIMAGDIKTIEIHLVSLDGNKLKKIELTEISKDDISSEYAGKVSLPTEPFKVLVKGTDSSDLIVERLFNQVYIGQTISVKQVMEKPIIMQANKTTEVGFTILNTGVKDTFILIASKEDGSLISLDSSEITLENNESKVIRVKFVAPNDIGNKSTYSVTLSAQSKSNSDSKNSAIYTAEVDNGDLDNDGMSDKMEKFIHDGNADEIADYNQSNVISILSKVTVGFTFELPKDSNFVDMFLGEVPESVEEGIEGKILFDLFDFEVSGIEVGTTKEMKIIYSGNIYPTEYYKYDEASKSWNKDTTAVFEKGYAVIKVDKAKQKGFLVFNNKRPSAYVEKQKVFMNESVTLDLLEKSNDEDGDTISIIHIDSTSYEKGTVTKATDSQSKVTYTAPSNFIGTDYFQYQITDARGGYLSVDVEIEVVEGSAEPIPAEPIPDEPKKSGGGGLGYLLPLLILGLLFFRRKTRK